MNKNSINVSYTTETVMSISRIWLLVGLVTVRSFKFFKVRGPFVQTLCIEKDSYMDAI